MTTTLNTLLISFDTGSKNATKAAACATVIQAVAKKWLKLFDGCWIIVDPQNAEEWLKRLDKAGPKSFDFALITVPILTPNLNGLYDSVLQNLREMYCVQKTTKHALKINPATLVQSRLDYR